MASAEAAELRAQGEPTKRLDRRLAWSTAVIGAGLAIGGVIFGSEKAAAWGVAGAAGGGVYHWITNPERRTRRSARMDVMRTEGSVSVLRRAGDIYLRGGQRKAA